MKKVAVSLMLAGLLLLAGCQKAAEAAANAALAKDGVQVNANGESATITGKDGTVTINTGGAAKLPADFPAEIPLYAGAKLASTVSVPGGVTVALETGDALAKVAEFYKSAMVSKGWKQDMDLNAADSAVLAFSKGKANLQVSCGAESGKTTIVLAYILPEK